MAHLTDSINAYVTPELIGRAANILGENEGGIAKAIGGMTPTILAGIMNKSGDAATMENIFKALGNFDAAGLDDPGSLLAAGNLAHDDPKDAAGRLLGILFGPKVPALANALAAFSGTKPSSVSALLGMVGPIVMAFLNKKISTDGLSAPGLANLLRSEKNHILGLLPTGLASIMDLSDMGDTAGDDTTGVTTGTPWLWPLLLLLGLGAAIIGYLKYCS